MGTISYQRVLGLDVGTKTIGVAIGYPRMQLSEPIQTVKRQSVQKDTEKLLLLCRQQAIDHIVVGLPLQLDGTEGRSVRLARQIGDKLLELGNVGVTYWDERFSTVEAARRLQENGKSSRDQKAIIDQAAAMVILEDWMRSY